MAGAADFYIDHYKSTLTAPGGAPSYFVSIDTKSSNRAEPCDALAAKG
jgi:hypothetical protein